MTLIALRPHRLERLAPARPVALGALGDDELAARVALGDDAAFVALYERFQPRLHAYARAIVRHEHDAGDAVQGAMVKALVALRATTLHSRVVPWLYRVVRNEAIDL